MTEYIYTLIYTIIYVFILNLFVETFVSGKNISKYLSGLFQVVMVLLNFGLPYLLTNHMAIKQILAVIVNAIILCTLYTIKLKKSLVLMVSFQGCEIAIEYLVLVILQYGFGLYQTIFVILLFS